MSTGMWSSGLISAVLGSQPTRPGTINMGWSLGPGRRRPGTIVSQARASEHHVHTSIGYRAVRSRAGPVCASPCCFRQRQEFAEPSRFPCPDALAMMRAQDESAPASVHDDRQFVMPADAGYLSGTIYQFAMIWRRDEYAPRRRLPGTPRGCPAVRSARAVPMARTRCVDRSFSS
jgi:hypothetical protein